MSVWCWIHKVEQILLLTYEQESEHRVGDFELKVTAWGRCPETKNALDFVDRLGGSHGARKCGHAHVHDAVRFERRVRGLDDNFYFRDERRCRENCRNRVPARHSQ